MLQNHQKTNRAILFAALIFIPIAAAHANSITYTLSGNGAGNINGTAFSGDFSFVLTSDTADVSPFGTEFLNTTLAGTFSQNGVHLGLTRDQASFPTRIPQPHG